MFGFGKKEVPAPETETLPAEEKELSGSAVNPEGKVLSPEEVKRQREDRFTREHIEPESWRDND